MSERTPAHDGMPRPLHPEGWAPPVGHAHGMAAAGRLVFVAGQVGWDPATATFTSDDVTTQTAQALRNVVAVLHVVQPHAGVQERDGAFAVGFSRGAHPGTTAVASISTRARSSTSALTITTAMAG